jgi:hypothetical protein
MATTLSRASRCCWGGPLRLEHLAPYWHLGDAVCAHCAGSVDRVGDGSQGELAPVRGCDLREVRGHLSQCWGDRTVAAPVATVAGGAVAQIERPSGLVPRVHRPADEEEQQDQSPT